MGFAVALWCQVRIVSRGTLRQERIKSRLLGAGVGKPAGEPLKRKEEKV